MSENYKYFQNAFKIRFLANPYFLGKHSFEGGFFYRDQINFSGDYQLQLRELWMIILEKIEKRSIHRVDVNISREKNIVLK